MLYRIADIIDDKEDDKEKMWKANIDVKEEGGCVTTLSTEDKLFLAFVNEYKQTVVFEKNVTLGETTEELLKKTKEGLLKKYAGYVIERNTGNGMEVDTMLNNKYLAYRKNNGLSNETIIAVRKG
jgi:hypothetical protein